jgi:hypothetical protein
LSQLTRELRCGADDVAGEYRSEYDEDTDDEVTEEDETEYASRTGSSGGKGDDELSDNEPSSSNTPGRKSAWFD